MLSEIPIAFEVVGSAGIAHTISTRMRSRRFICTFRFGSARWKGRISGEMLSASRLIEFDCPPILCRWRCGQHQPRQNESERRREQAKRTERVQDKRLHVEQEQGAQEHRRHADGEEHARSRITESSERRQAKDDKISQRAESSRRNVAHARVNTPEHNGTSFEGPQTESSPARCATVR